MKTIDISKLSSKAERLNFIKSAFSNNRLDIEIKYLAVFSNTKILRDFIIDLADFFKFEWNWESRLTLIADELNNNWIEYWSKEDDYNFMRIKLELIWDEIDLFLEVEDSWKWKDAKTAEEMIEKRKQKEEEKRKIWFQANWIRWRWLYLIITKLVDDLYFKNSKRWWLIVWIRKKIKIQKS